MPLNPPQLLCTTCGNRFSPENAKVSCVATAGSKDTVLMLDVTIACPKCGKGDTTKDHAIDIGKLGNYAVEIT